MDVKQEINFWDKSIYIYHTSLFFKSLRKIDLKTTIRVTLVQEVRHNGQRMDTAFRKAQDDTNITFQHTYDLFLILKLILQNLKVY